MSLPTPRGDVAALLAGYPPAARKRLLALRRLIFETARANPVVGRLTETLKWGQPAYLTGESGSGTTIRLGWSPARPEECALLFHCGTTLVSDFRSAFSETLRFDGNRAIVFDLSQPLPLAVLGRCVGAALTYHSDKRRPRRPRVRARRAR